MNATDPKIERQRKSP